MYFVEENLLLEFCIREKFFGFLVFKASFCVFEGFFLCFIIVRRGGKGFRFLEIVVICFNFCYFDCEMKVIWVRRLK